MKERGPAQDVESVGEPVKESENDCFIPKEKRLKGK